MEFSHRFFKHFPLYNILMTNLTEFPTFEDSCGQEWNDFLETITPEDLNLDSALFQDLPPETWSPILRDTSIPSDFHLSPAHSSVGLAEVDLNLTGTTIPIWETDPGDQKLWEESGTSGPERPPNPDIEALHRKIETLEQR